MSYNLKTLRVSKGSIVRVYLKLQDAWGKK